MKYYKAEFVLPADLWDQVRRYIPEGVLYIGRSNQSRRKWGEISGERTRIDRRNAQIRARHQDGESIPNLASAYHLSDDTIKRIVYRR